MTLNYDTITALIAEHYTPMLYDLVFQKQNIIVKMLKDKAKEYIDRRIEVPLEYDNGSKAEFTVQYQILTLQAIDPVTAAFYEPKMLTDTILISKEEELVANSDRAVKNISDVKMKNVMKGLEKAFIQNFWSRDTQGTKAWNTLKTIVGTGTVGAIAGADYAWWQSKIVDLETSSFYAGNSPQLEDDLVDPSSKVHILKLIQRLVRLSANMTGEDPTVLIIPEYIWDLLESIYNSMKRGDLYNKKAAELGFSALDYHGIPVVCDKWDVAAQLGDTDGYLWALNLDYLYMFFNPGAKFTVGKWTEPANQSSMSAKIHTYGQLCVSNRLPQVCFKNVLSPQNYSTA